MRTRTRKRVLDFVASHPDATSSDIARALGLAAPAVRHHLAILRSDQRIEQFGSGSDQGRGRPRARYRLAERLKGDNLGMVADALLKTFGWPSAAKRRRATVQQLAEALKRMIGPVESHSGPASRVTDLVRRLEALHYEARWEAGAEGPRILFAHCPYAAIINDHPILCEMDAAAISEVLGATTRQVAKIDPNGKGARQCVFSLH